MGPKYQVVIPRPVRDSLKLRAEDTLLFLVDGDTVMLRNRPASFTAALRGLHKEICPADPDAWLAEERKSWEQNDSEQRSWHPSCC